MKRHEYAPVVVTGVCKAENCGRLLTLSGIVLATVVPGLVMFHRDALRVLGLWVVKELYVRKYR